jgi:hypothetical protein
MHELPAAKIGEIPRSTTLSETRTALAASFLKS